MHSPFAHGTRAPLKRCAARLALFLALFGAHGCSGENAPRLAATGGDGGSAGDGNTGGRGDVGTGGSGGSGGSGPITIADAGPPDPDAACQQAEVHFVPKV